MKVRVRVTHEFEIDIDETIVTTEALEDIADTVFDVLDEDMDPDARGAALVIASQLTTGDEADISEAFGLAWKGVSYQEINFVAETIE